MKEFLIEGSNGLSAVAIKNNVAEATIYLHGAHITDYKINGAESVLWLSDKAIFKAGKSIKGGIPICWPWFGTHPSDESKPFHGFARNLDWELKTVNTDNSEETIVELELCDTEETMKLFPYKFNLVMRFAIGATLKAELVTTNTDDKLFTVGGALHTYFNIENIRNIKISGLENCEYYDAVDEWKMKKQEGAISFSGELDRVYINTRNACIIQDDLLKRDIIVSKCNSNSTVVWNPWIDKSKESVDLSDNSFETMVCVETTNALKDVYEVKPGEKHSLILEISNVNHK